MEHDISYDSQCECYVWWYNGAGMCLAAETHADAESEVQDLIDHDIYPEDAILAEGEEEVEYYDDGLDDEFIQSLSHMDTTS